MVLQMWGFHVPIFWICKGADYGLENKGQCAFYFPKTLPREELENKDNSADSPQWYISAFSRL